MRVFPTLFLFQMPLGWFWPKSIFFGRQKPFLPPPSPPPAPAPAGPGRASFANTLPWPWPCSWSQFSTVLSRSLYLKRYPVVETTFPPFSELVTEIFWYYVPITDSMIRSFILNLPRSLPLLRWSVQWRGAPRGSFKYLKLDGSKCENQVLSAVASLPPHTPVSDSCQSPPQVSLPDCQGSLSMSSWFHITENIKISRASEHWPQKFLAISSWP